MLLIVFCADIVDIGKSLVWVDCDKLCWAYARIGEVGAKAGLEDSEDGVVRGIDGCWTRRGHKVDEVTRGNSLGVLVRGHKEEEKDKRTKAVVDVEVTNEKTETRTQRKLRIPIWA